MQGNLVVQEVLEKVISTPTAFIITTLFWTHLLAVLIDTAWKPREEECSLMLGMDKVWINKLNKLMAFNAKVKVCNCHFHLVVSHVQRPAILISQHGILLICNFIMTAAFVVVGHTLVTVSFICLWSLPAS